MSEKMSHCEKTLCELRNSLNRMRKKMFNRNEQQENEQKKKIHRMMLRTNDENGISEQ